MSIFRQPTPFLGRDLFLRRGTSDHAIWTHTYEWGYNDPPPIPTPKNVLDLGSYVGITTAMYQHLWPKARIVGVDMDPSNCKIAGMNFRGEILCKAVTFSQEGTIGYGTASTEASYLIGHGRKKAEAIGILPLLADLFGDEDLDFCKMDIEGVEWDLLAGASWWVSHVRALQIELHGDHPFDPMKVLEKYGFSVQQHPKHDRTLWAIRT